MLALEENPSLSRTRTSTTAERPASRIASAALDTARVAHLPLFTF